MFIILQNSFIILTANKTFNTKHMNDDKDMVIMSERNMYVIILCFVFGNKR